MKVALRFVARRVTPDNTCSAIYDVSMVLLQLQTSAAWTEVVALLWWHSGTVLTSLNLLLILDISRGATPIHNELYHFGVVGKCKCINSYR